MQHSQGTRLRFHKVPFIFGAAIALALSVAGAGPAGASSWGPRTWTVQVGSESWDQEIQGMAFLPSDITVNEGDSINWLANSAEIHTVTFLAAGQSLGPFNPANPDQLFKRGGDQYDGNSYYNSGILSNVEVPGFPSEKSYELEFKHGGDFTYYCLVHGMAMKGTVHVQERGSAYPHSQRDYDRSSAAQEEAILKDGMKLDDALARHASNHKVFTGDDDGIAMVMRFVQPTVTVHVGDTVHFINPGMEAPHTVTFGNEPVNIFAPSGDPEHYGGGDLSSGLMVANEEQPPTFDVKFTAAGTFKYICALHDYMGMVGKVIVVD